jgi:hypothetical protein
MPTTVTWCGSVYAHNYRWTCPHCKQTNRSQIPPLWTEKFTRCGKCKRSVYLVGLQAPEQPYPVNDPDFKGAYCNSCERALSKPPSCAGSRNGTSCPHYMKHVVPIRGPQPPKTCVERYAKLNHTCSTCALHMIPNQECLGNRDLVGCGAWRNAAMEHYASEIKRRSGLKLRDVQVATLARKDPAYNPFPGHSCDDCQDPVDPHSSCKGNAARTACEGWRSRTSERRPVRRSRTVSGCIGRKKER